MSLPEVNFIWIGDRLGPLHQACMASFLRTDHKVRLFAYSKPVDCPDGVGIINAEELWPEDKLFRHRATGSLAVVSDLMRYRLLSKGYGLYVDCDVYCHRPIEDEDYIFGWQTNLDVQSINNAVLKLPSGSELLSDLLGMERPGFLPPWSYARRRRLRNAIDTLRGRPHGPADFPLGDTGPNAITWFAKQRGLTHYAKPTDVFYGPGHLELLLDPGLSIEDVSTPRTRYIHVLLLNKRQEQFPPTSPVGRMIALAL